MLHAAVPSLALQAQGVVAGETTKPSASNAAKKEISKYESKSSDYLGIAVKVFGLEIVALVIIYIFLSEHVKKHTIDLAEDCKRRIDEKFKESKKLRELEELKKLKELKRSTVEDFIRSGFYFLEESCKDLLDKMEQAKENWRISVINKFRLIKEFAAKRLGLDSIKCAIIALNDIYYSHEIYENIAIEKKLYPERTEKEILESSPDIKNLKKRLVKGKLIKENSWKKEIESCFDALNSTSVISVPENLEKLVKNNNFEDRTVWDELRKFIQELSTIIEKIESGEYNLELEEKIRELDEKIKIEENSFYAARDELFNRLTGKVEELPKAKNLENTDHSNFADSTALVPYSGLNF